MARRPTYTKPDTNPAPRAYAEPALHPDIAARLHATTVEPKPAPKRRPHVITTHHATLALDITGTPGEVAMACGVLNALCHQLHGNLKPKRYRHGPHP